MASGQFNNETQQWEWERAVWKQNTNGMWYSNRKIPDEYWNQWKGLSRKKTSDRAGVILVKRDFRGNLCFWMIQSYHNLYGFPKGSLNEGETFQQAAEREFKEETGTPICLDNALELRFIEKGSQMSFFIVVMTKNFEITTVPEADVEITGFGWVTAKNFYNMKLSGLTKKIMKTYRKSPHTVKTNSISTR